MLSSSSSVSYSEHTTSTPTSPMSEEFNYNEEMLRVIRKIGYMNGTKIGKTLQGSIWKIYKKSKSCDKVETAVLKSTTKYLHKRSLAIISGKECKIKENIFDEQKILKYLTDHQNCPKSIVRYHWFFKTNTDYYLLMENGGDSLFKFVEEAHQMLHSGYLERSEWKKAVRVILDQMIESVHYIHSKSVCHFDISLLNFVINDVQIEMYEGHDHKQKMKFVLDEIQIKLIDFGLAHFFDDTTSFQCNKFCGKKRFQSPELRASEPFDAKKNDIWGIGICLFMMIFGIAPWNVADDNDANFLFVKNHSLAHLLNGLKVESLIDEQMLRLLNSIFQYERNRISLQNMKQYMC